MQGKGAPVVDSSVNLRLATHIRLLICVRLDRTVVLLSHIRGAFFSIVVMKYIGGLEIKGVNQSLCDTRTFEALAHNGRCRKK